MVEIKHRNYHPLEREEINSLVPPQPGVLVLAVQLASGVYQPIHITQTQNLYKSLRTLLTRVPDELPQAVVELLRKFKCYFTFVAIEPQFHSEYVQLMAESFV